MVKILKKMEALYATNWSEVVPYLLARLTMEPTGHNCPGVSGGRLLKWYVVSLP